MTTPLHIEPPDLVEPDLLPHEIVDAVAALAAAYDCSQADIVRWVLDDDGPEGIELDPDIEPGESPVSLVEHLRWEITDDGAAEWALRKLDEARSNLLAVNRQADEFAAPLRERLARVDEWRRNASEGSRRSVEFFTAHLERWALARRERTGAASQHLPSGAIETRRVPASVKLDDDELLAEQVLDYAIPVPIAVRRKVDARALNKIARGAWEISAELSCGHVQLIGLDALPAVGVELPCGPCCPDAATLAGPSDNWPRREAVTIISNRVVVVDSDNVEGGPLVLEGCHEVPERVTVTLRTDHVEL